MTRIEKSLKPETAVKLRRLKGILKKMGKAMVAFSGGVDSTFLLKTAMDVMGGEEALAVLAVSETYPQREILEAKKLARALKTRLRVIKTRELDNPDFIKNPPERCYFCKMELFSRIRALARREGIPHVLDGSNVDDRKDFRPGTRASRELGVRSPLREAGLTKDEIREISRLMDLPTWNKPSMACLASRFPYGTDIDRESLTRIGRAEEVLRDAGFTQVRVRHHGQIARIEISPAEFIKIIAGPLRIKVIRKIKECGFLYVALDLEGYRTGSMNEALTPNEKTV